MLLWEGLHLGLIRRMNSRKMARQLLGVIGRRFFPREDQLLSVTNPIKSRQTIPRPFSSCQAQLTSNVEAWSGDATKQDPDLTQNPEFRPIKQELIRLLMEKHQSLMEFHSNVLKSPEEHNSSRVCQVSEIQHFESFRGNLQADMKIMTPGEDHEVSEFWRHGQSVNETTYPMDPHQHIMTPGEDTEFEEYWAFQSRKIERGSVHKKAIQHHQEAIFHLMDLHVKNLVGQCSLGDILEAYVKQGEQMPEFDITSLDNFVNCPQP